MTQKGSREGGEESPRTAASSIPFGSKVVRTFQREMSHQKRAVERALLARTHLKFVVDAMTRLNSDAHFLTLLRAETMHTAPKLIFGSDDLEVGREDAGATVEMPARGAPEEVTEVDVETSIRDLKSGALTSIQEHYVVVRLISRGISAEYIAGALGVGVAYIRYKAALLNKISPEVANLFKDLRIAPHAFNVLRKMTEKRQIEVANLMIAAGNHTYRYARGLLAATQQSDLMKPKRISGIASGKMAQMEQEMAELQGIVLDVERTYGDDLLNLVIARGYVAKLICNGEIERFLESNHSEILEGFRGVIAATSLA